MGIRIIYGLDGSLKPKHAHVRNTRRQDESGTGFYNIITGECYAPVAGTVASVSLSYLSSLFLLSPSPPPSSPLLLFSLSLGLSLSARVCMH
jgi:hypothetical protein